MAKDIFISYAQGDREWAEQVCAQLEEAGISCWIAPRDIAPGVTWPAAITEAISQCRAMIVVFSQHANASRQMAREVEVADSRHVPILPVRVEDIEPAGDMEYFLGNRQWFDLHGGKLERRRALPAAISSLLGQGETFTAPAPPAPPKLQPKPAGIPRGIAFAAAGGVVIVGAVVAVVMTRQKQPPAPAPAAIVTPAPAPIAQTPPPAAAPTPTPAPVEIPKPKPAVKREPPAPAKPAANFNGKWEAEIKYSWGLTRKETFIFKVDEGDVMGTASYVGGPRGILDGKVEGNRISFTTKSQTLLGSQTYEEKHAYKGRISGDSIEFILQTDSGYDTRPPEMFTARRAEP